MESEDIRLMTVALWLQDKPGRSSNCSYAYGVFHVTLWDCGVGHFGDGATIEDAFAGAFAGWSRKNPGQRTMGMVAVQ